METIPVPVPVAVLFLSPLLLLGLEFLVIHHAADGGLDVRRDFHQIQPAFEGHLPGLSRRHNAQDTAVRAHQAHPTRREFDR
jgi:hypothetical protein